MIKRLRNDEDIFFWITEKFISELWRKENSPFFVQRIPVLTCQKFHFLPLYSTFSHLKNILTNKIIKSTTFKADKLVKNQSDKI